MNSPIIGRVTIYGYKDDTTPDSNSLAGIGAWDNLLSPSSLAISRDIEARFRAAGIKPGDWVRLLLDNGSAVTKTWDDRTAKSYRGKLLTGRFDFYEPAGRSVLDGHGVLSFRKLDTEKVTNS